MSERELPVATMLQGDGLPRMGRTEEKELAEEVRGRPCPEDTSRHPPPREL